LFHVDNEVVVAFKFRERMKKLLFYVDVLDGVGEDLRR